MKHIVSRKVVGRPHTSFILSEMLLFNLVQQQNQNNHSKCKWFNDMIISVYFFLIIFLSSFLRFHVDVEIQKISKERMTVFYCSVASVLHKRGHEEVEDVGGLTENVCFFSVFITFFSSSSFLVTSLLFDIPVRLIILSLSFCIFFLSSSLLLIFSTAAASNLILRC